MKAKNTLLIMLCLASSAVIAQSSQPQLQSDSQPLPQSGVRKQPGNSTQKNQSNSQSTPQPEQPSSGSSGQSQSAFGASSSQSPAENTSSSASSGQIQAQRLPAPAPVTQLEPKTENGFTYLCGGVGKEEVRQMKQAARNYDMTLTFATRKGDYLADVNVDIRGQQGKLELKATCDGPIMLIDVPKSSTYVIRAETGGYTLNKTTRVQAKGRSHASVVLTWPQQVANATESAQTSSGSSGATDKSSGNNGAR